jgi:hypothetical protein
VFDDRLDQIHAGREWWCIAPRETLVTLCDTLRGEARISPFDKAVDRRLDQAQARAGALLLLPTGLPCRVLQVSSR